MTRVRGISIVVLAGALVGCASPSGGTQAGSVQPMGVRSGQVALADALSDGIVKQFPNRV